MADIAGNIDKLNDIEISNDAPVTQALFYKIAENINAFIEKMNPVGTIVSSILSEAQFQAEASTNWVLCNGQTCVGSRLQEITSATNVPDLRDVFLRGKGNGRALNPDGDLALGTYTTQKIPGHNHIIGDSLAQPFDGTILGSYTIGPLSDERNNLDIIYTTPGLFDGQTAYVLGTNSYSGVGNANEVAPASVIVNYFIRID